jgi:hypothetical protein
MSNKKIIFFGYGANRNRQKISQIIGYDPGEGVGAVLENYILCIQLLIQVPEPIRKFLTQVYGPEFKSYTIRKGEGLVSGTIWELTEEDIGKIHQWEFIGSWREMVNIAVTTSRLTQIQAITEKAPDQQDYEEVVDGLLYDEFRFIDLPQTRAKQTRQYYTQKQIGEIEHWLSQQADFPVIHTQILNSNTKPQAIKQFSTKK